ncbi:hypothetical protein ACE3MS_15395 [Paenibacillus dendritiformis]|uniref:hypothetical protein n=1 Tax=Paenibacillus dendritiformis TaxID=130049 RepID=UPI003668981C
MEIKRCTGCGEVAEVQGEDDLCFYCQKHEDLMHEFMELENEEIRIAEETWDGRYKSGDRRKAGQPIHGDPKHVDLAWLNRGYVIDASDYIPAGGQIDLFEILEGGI